MPPCERKSSFRINEIGVYDLPALIDYVLETTKQSSLHYVGFSQGTTVFFLMGSERSEYLSKVKLMSAFGPTVYMENPKSPIVKFIADNWKLGEVGFQQCLNIRFKFLLGTA